MTSLSFGSLPAWATCLSLVAHFAVGIVVGVLYFRSLWWNARRFTSGSHVATTIAVMIGRFGRLMVIATFGSISSGV